MRGLTLLVCLSHPGVSCEPEGLVWQVGSATRFPTGVGVGVGVLDRWRGTAARPFNE